MNTRPCQHQRCRAPAWYPAIALIVLAGCGTGSTGTVQSGEGRGIAPGRPAPARVPPSHPFHFTDIAPGSGIEFVHTSGMDADKHFPTIMGSGVAMFDYDGDGRLDLYFATGTFLPIGKAKSGTNRLYRNLGGGIFRDVTGGSGLDFAGYSYGIAVGDIDNDGRPDVFLATYQGNRLFHNEGGTFRDITAAAGLTGETWCTAGAFLDYDGDGDLDLYIANYGEWTLPRDDVFCGNPERTVRIYCSPRSVKPARHTLYRNDGGGRSFSDVSDAAGLGRTDGRGLGVVAADLDDDGRTDLYVANDMCPNFLFLNRGDGTFRDASEDSGAAYDDQGRAQASMGVDAEDIDGDGRPELFVTNYADEYNTIYLNLGGGNFADQTAASGLAAASLPFVGWGCALADFDNDGRPDCFVTNGHVDDNLALVGQTGEYAQPPLLHRNLGARKFGPAVRDAGLYFASDHVGRGAAFGDLDDDGDLDIVVNHKDGPPALLRNDSGADRRWIRLHLVGTRSNRDAIGARVEVVAGGRTLHRRRKGGASLGSAHDPRLLIGLGASDEATSVTVRWPSGGVTRMGPLAAGRTYEVVEPTTGPGTAAGMTGASVAVPRPVR